MDQEHEAPVDDLEAVEDSDEEAAFGDGSNTYSKYCVASAASRG